MLKMFSRQNLQRSVQQRVQQWVQRLLQRFVQRCFLQRLCVAWLLGTVLWSSSVAVAAAAMGCCDQPQACCTVGAALSCATCVPPLSAPSALPSVLPAGAVASTVSAGPVHTLPVAHTDIWRPPKTLATFTVF